MPDAAEALSSWLKKAAKCGGIGYVSLIGLLVILSTSGCENTSTGDESRVTMSTSTPVPTVARTPFPTPTTARLSTPTAIRPPTFTPTVSGTRTRLDTPTVPPTRAQVVAPTTTLGHQIVGDWLDAEVGDRIKILMERGQLRMEYKMGGNIFRFPVVESRSPMGRRFDERGSSQFYVIDSQGNLQIWGPSGLITTARKLR